MKKAVVLVGLVAAAVAACTSSSTSSTPTAGFGGTGGSSGVSSGGSSGGGDGGACVPNCGGKSCGDDGCGGGCGVCGQYQTCDDATHACVASCDLTPLDASKTIDLNLTVADVTGKVTWNGGAPPSTSNARVVFTDKKTNAVTSVALGATYAVKVYASTYSIGIDTRGASSALPDQLAIVKDDVVVVGGASIDLTVATSTVSGKVTVDGAAATAGSVLLRTAAGGQVLGAVSASGDGTYSLPVFTGTYDVSFDSRGAAGALPDQTALFKKGVAVSVPATLDVAMATTTLSGTLTQNGAALPTETTHGSVRLSGADVTAASGDVAPAGTYSIKAYTGAYDVAFDSRSATVLPQQVVTLAAGKALGGAVPGNFDLKVVDLTGKITLNGAALPDDTTSRGTLELVAPQGSGVVAVDLSSAGPATYAAHLYAGTYDIRVRSGGQQHVLPAQRATVKRAVAVTASAAVDLNLATAAVHGTITVDGAALADGTQSRGDVTFVERTTGDRYAVSAGTTGTATYSVVLYTGTYGVEFRSASTDKALPDQATHVTDQKIAADATVDIPLKTLTVSGGVKVNGADMGPASQSRGSVVFVEKLTGSRVAVDVGASGPAAYSLRLFDGGYDVHFEASSSQSAIPDVDERVLRGCIPVTASCSLDAKDLGGSWLLAFPAWGTMDLTLTQSGTGLGGYASSSWGAGPVTVGTRTTSSVKLTADTSSIFIDMTGDVVNGCVMSGTAVASTGYTSDWIGQRLE